MSNVAHTNESFHTHEHLVAREEWHAYEQMSDATHTDDSCRTNEHLVAEYKYIMSTHTDESCTLPDLSCIRLQMSHIYIYKCVIYTHTHKLFYIYIMYTHTGESYTLTNLSCIHVQMSHIYTWVMYTYTNGSYIHVHTSHLTHAHESCHTYQWVLLHMWRSCLSHVTCINAW